MKGATLNLEPLGDRVLVKPIPNDDTTPGGIIIPAAAQEKSQRGEVIAVGDDIGTRTIDTPEGETTVPIVEVGSEVVYSLYGGTELNVGDEEVLVLREPDIMCRVKPAEESPSAAVAEG